MAVDGVENSNRSRVDPDEVWRSFREIIDLASEIFSTVTQLGFVLQLSRSDYGGLIFGALCISEPLLNLIGGRDLWSKGQYSSYYMWLAENQCLLLGFQLMSCIPTMFTIFACVHCTIYRQKSTDTT
jgi:hypothetical protein